tara:strand:+ start:277 stop:1296 length:1020 start_codon:yes stop_codon:yes gene_type:complete
MADYNWVQNETRLIPIDDLVIEEEGSQVRQGGINSSHVAVLTEDISLRGQQVPITIGAQYPAGHPSAGKFPVVEGNHRLTAIRQLRHNATSDEDLDKYGMILVYESSFSSEEERTNWQLACNEHVPAKASTNDDYALVLRNQLDSKNLKGTNVNGVTWKNFSEKENNFKLVKKWCKNQWGINGTRINSIVKLALRGNPNAKLVNYTKDTVLECFGDNNNIGWTGKKSGEECNNHTVYAISQASHVFPNLTGNTFRVKTDNTRTTTVALFWETNTLGKKVKDIKSFRTSAMDKVNKANSSALLAPNASLVDKVVFAPQMKSEKDLIWAEKDSNGRFKLRL